MKKSNKNVDRKSIITLVLLGMAAIATIIFNETRSDKPIYPDLDGVTSKVMPSKPQSIYNAVNNHKTAHWKNFLCQNQQ
jgi:hypothetical protein